MTLVRCCAAYSCRMMLSKTCDDSLSNTYSGVVALAGGSGDNCPPPLNFILSKTLLLVAKFSSKNKQNGAGNPHTGRNYGQN